VVEGGEGVKTKKPSGGGVRDWEGKQANGPMAPCCEKLWAISKKYGSLN